MSAKIKGEDNIIRMSREHLDGVCEIEQVCFTDPWTRRMFELNLYNEHNLNFVYFHENSTAGYICLSIAGGEMDIENIAVNPACQKNGIGQKLLSYAISIAQNAFCENIFLEVRESNSTAVRLYKKNFFEIISKRINYYDNPREDALLMVKKIIKPGVKK